MLVSSRSACALLVYSPLSITNIATPLSAVRMTLVLSCLSWVRALYCAGLRLHWVWCWCCFRSLLTSDLNSSASWVFNLAAATSVAVM